MTELKNLSNTDIIQLQYNLLEELKQKNNGGKNTLSVNTYAYSSVDEVLSDSFKSEKRTESPSARITKTAKKIIDESKYSYGDAIEYFASKLDGKIIEKPLLKDYEEFIFQKFHDSLGNLENEKEYYCRLSWFDNNCPTYKELSKIIGYKAQTIGNYASKFNWREIKEQAMDLGYRLGNPPLFVQEVSSFADATEKIVERNSPEYLRYREKVLKRDGVCQCCGSKDDLQVHHPLPYNQYNSLRADTNNGIVLCKECHDEYHNRNGYKRDVNPITLAQFLRDYGMSTQSKLLDDNLNLRAGDIENNFVRDLFITPSTLIDRLKSQSKSTELKSIDIIEERWSIQIFDNVYDTYIPQSEVREMFYTYLHYLNKRKGITINESYNTHKVKQAMENYGFNTLTKNVTNENGMRSSVRIWDKCIVNQHKWNKIKEMVG